jgi:hypothetical protein
MPLTAPELAELMHTFWSSQDDGAVAELEEHVKAWQESPDALTLCLEVIGSPSTAFSDALNRMCASMIAGAMTNDAPPPDFFYERTYEAIVTRLTSDPALDFGVLHLLLYALASVVVTNTDYLDAVIDQLSADRHLYFVARLIDHAERRSGLQPALLEPAHELLVQHPVDADWLDLHATAYLCTGSLVVFADLLPRLQGLIREDFPREWIPVFCKWLTALTVTPPENYRDDEPAYAAAAVDVVLQLAAVLLGNPAYADFVAVILSEVFDSFPLNYLSEEQNHEFGQAIFDACFAAMSQFVEARDMDNFLTLLRMVSVVFTGPPPEETTLDIPAWIIQLLDALFQLLDSDPDSFYGDERVTEVLQDVFYELSVIKDDAVLEFLRGKEDFSSPTFFFVASYVQESYRMPVLADLEQFIAEGGDPGRLPLFAVDFVASCGEFVTDDGLAEAFAQVLRNFWATASLDVLSNAALGLAKSNPHLLSLESFIEPIRDGEWIAAARFMAAAMLVLRISPDPVIPFLELIADRIRALFHDDATGANELAIFSDDFVPVCLKCQAEGNHRDIFRQFFDQVFGDVLPKLFTVLEGTRSSSSLVNKSLELVTVLVPLIDWPWEQLIKASVTALIGWPRGEWQFDSGLLLPLWAAVAERHHNSIDVAKLLIRTVEQQIGEPCPEMRAVAARFYRRPEGATGDYRIEGFRKLLLRFAA